MTKFKIDDTIYKINPKYKRTLSIKNVKNLFIKKDRDQDTKPKESKFIPKTPPKSIEKFVKSQKLRRKSKTSSLIYIYSDFENPLNKDDFDLNKLPTLKTEIAVN